MKSKQWSGLGRCINGLNGDLISSDNVQNLTNTETVSSHHVLRDFRFKLQKVRGLRQFERER